jgi:hypothetical protein
MTPKGTRRSRVRDPSIPTNDARGAQPFPGRLMERDVPVMSSKEDIATDTERIAEYVATMIATTSLKRGECAGDTEQILKNAVTNGDADTMRQKEGCVGCITDQNAARKDVNTMP